MSRRHVVVAGAATLLIVLAAKVDWHTAATTASRARPLPLVAATAVNFASLLVAGLRWKLFLAPLDRRAGRLALRGVVIGAAANNLLVASGGEAARALLVSRATGVRRTAVLATIALDRLFDPICFCVFSVATTYLVRLPPAFAHVRVIGILSLVAATLVFAYLARSGGTTDWTSPVIGFRGRARLFRQHVQQLASPERFIRGMALSLGVWVMQAVVFALVASAVHVNVPVAGTIAALLLTNAGLIMRLTPGNVGYFQLAYAVATKPFGVSAEAAVTVSLLIQFLQIIPVTAAGIALAPRLIMGRDQGP